MSVGVKENMHIVYVTGGFAEKEGQVLGGMPNYIYKISKLVQQRGHCVTILTIGKAEKEWRFDGIKVVSRKIPANCFGYFPLTCYQFLLMPILREHIFNKALKEIDSKNPIDLVQYAGWFGVGMLYSGRYPSILRISTYIKEQLTGNYTCSEKKLITFCEKMAAKRFHGIVAPSYALGRKYARDVNRRVTVIRTPFECRNVQEDDTLVRTVLKDKRYYLFFGRISVDKGIGTIEKAINNILAINTDIYFVLAGEVVVYNNVNMLKRLYKTAGKNKNRIIYAGNLEHSRLIPVIRHAEAVVLPSLMDNLPNAGLESMYYNGILIGTRGASFDEMIKDNISGLLIDIDDAAQLEEKIKQVEHMTAEQKAHMRVCARKALKKFDPDKTAEDFLAYYNRIVDLWQRKHSQRNK